jgi:hypothetical protein
MSCDELRDEYELYALGLADEAPATELREHLRQGCQTCGAGMLSAQGLMTMLGATAPAMAPRPELRRRILAAVGAGERRGWGWAPLWIAVSALSMAAAFYFYGRDRDNGLQAKRFQQQARAQLMELTRLNEALEILNQADTRQVTFGAAEKAPPHGRIFVNPKSGVLLVASNLPPAPAGKIYEMWVIPKQGLPVAAGIFQAGETATAVHVRKLGLNLAATQTIAVTLEPAGGVPQPTSQPVIVAGLSN